MRIPVSSPRAACLLLASWSRPASLVMLLLFAAGRPVFGQQVIDTVFRQAVGDPAFRPGAGPLVLIDAAHENFHTRAGRYRAFAALLEADGYRVDDLAQSPSSQTLSGAALLVIANAGLPSDRPWSLPARSAFRAEEIDAIVNWVRGGGSVLLIVDHLPAGGAALELGRRLGVEFTNGYTVDPRSAGPDLFSRADSTLLDHPITRGRSRLDQVDSVATFTGQGFQLTEPADVLLRFGPRAFTWLPVRANTGGGFDSLTARVHSGGWPHAVAKRLGAGRVVIVGEAGGFTAQWAGPNRNPMGLNHPKSVGNQRFVRNIVHWLTGLIN